MRSAIIVAQKGVLTSALFHSIKNEINIKQIYFEKPENKCKILFRRYKKIGLFKVFDQAIFSLIIPPIIRFKSKRRINELFRKYQLNINSIPQKLVTHITSVNSNSFISSIEHLDIQYILVNGTRIVGSKTLNATSATWLNIHVGITPTYRGVHGGYWAIASGDIENFGVTLHKLDAGIDTGEIISQSRIVVTRADNYATYPILQYARGIELLKDYLRGKKSNPLSNKPDQSNVFYHPGLTFYLKNKILKTRYDKNIA